MAWADMWNNCYVNERRLRSVGLEREERRERGEDGVVGEQQQETRRGTCGRERRGVEDNRREGVRGGRGIQEGRGGEERKEVEERMKVEKKKGKNQSS